MIICVFAVMSANAQINSVAIVGTAVGGWPGEAGNPGPIDVHQLTKIDADNWKITGLTITAGACKLRANNSWSGPGYEFAGAFPTAIGTSSGDINVPTSSVYTVELNATTGRYLFTAETAIPVVNLVGTAVTGGTVAMTATSPSTFKLDNATLLAGNAQFQIDGVLSGDVAFPTGIAAAGAATIPVPAGTYLTVTLDLNDGTYNFVAGFPEIGLIGSGTTGTSAGWNADIAKMATSDGVTYTLKGQQLYSLNTTDGSEGKVKFRTFGAWTQDWGGTSFPTGPSGNNSDIVVTPAGYYDITFNRITGAYSFSFPEIGLIGSGTTGTSAGWNADIAKMATSDGVNYTLTQQLYSLNTTDGSEGKVKFRTFGAWNQDWGGTSFPTGPTGNNSDIVVTPAGTYAINFNRVTGIYNFGTALAVTKFDANTVSVYPNPSSNSWNFRTANTVIKSIQIFDINGKSVKTVSAKDSAATVDASGLSKGVYFAKVSTDTSSETIKLIKN